MVDYTLKARRIERDGREVDRLRNVALGFRYSGKRVQEEAAHKQMIDICKRNDVPCPELARLVTKGKAV